ncbi:hypothetical protein, partial [Microbispora rosea]|uniref:hypothetical protein n=1 Tax=Microbispora rosea TaxID=58117 RepID=UPI0004C3827E
MRLPAEVFGADGLGRVVGGDELAGLADDGPVLAGGDLLGGAGVGDGDGGQGAGELAGGGSEPFSCRDTPLLSATVIDSWPGVVVGWMFTDTSTPPVAGSSSASAGPARPAPARARPSTDAASIRVVILMGIAPSMGGGAGRLV